MSNGGKLQGDRSFAVRTQVAGIINRPAGSGAAGTAFLTPEEFDGTDSGYYFYGGLDASSDWKINRYDKTTFAKTSADENGNPSYVTMSAAWTDRLTLSYS